MSASIELKRLASPFLNIIWDEKLDQRSWWRRFLVKTARIIFAVLRDLKDGQLSLRAMSLVYTTVIAIVPLLALSFSVLKGFDLHQKMEPALIDSLSALGEKRFDIASKIMEFVDNVKVGVLGALGFSLLIYSVLSMMHKIERSFNYTWQIRRGRHFAQRFKDYLSVIFVGPLLIMLSVGITTSIRAESVLTYLSGSSLGETLLGWLGWFLPYMMMSLGFAFIYLFLPNTRVRLSAALVGGLVTAVIWKLMGWGIANFVANSANKIQVYSAFASVIILMMWLYIAWLVLLVGASVAFYFQNPQFIKVRRDAIQLSVDAEEKLSLQLLCDISDHFNRQAAPWTCDTLAKALSIPPHLLADRIDKLIDCGYLMRVGDDDELFPRMPPNEIYVDQVLSRLRENDSNSPATNYVATPDIERLTEELAASRQQALAGRTIADLLQAGKARH